VKLRLASSVCGFVALLSAEAFADRAACFQAALEGQNLRDEHKLIEAKERFRVCAQQDCPISMRGDCAAWLDDAERGIVTVVIVATDAGGASVYDVRVTVDGRPLADRLDGRSLSIDPGVHTLRVERADGASVQRAIVANEGEKDQKLVVVLPGAPHPTPQSDGATAAPLTPVARAVAPVTAAPFGNATGPAAVGPFRRAAGLSTRKVFGLAEGAAGVAALVVGGVFGGLAAAAFDRQKADCPPTSCTANGHAQGLADHSSAVNNAVVSTAALTLGGGFVLGGVLLWFLPEPPLPGTPGPPSGVSPGARMVSLRGEF
jgi:hypothetical protein